MECEICKKDVEHLSGKIIGTQFEEKSKCDICKDKGDLVEEEEVIEANEVKADLRRKYEEDKVMSGYDE